MMPVFRERREVFSLPFRGKKTKRKGRLYGLESGSFVAEKAWPSAAVHSGPLHRGRRTGRPDVCPSGAQGGTGERGRQGPVPPTQARRARGCSCDAEQSLRSPLATAVPLLSLRSR